MNLFDYEKLINNRPMHIATVNKDNNPNLSVASDVRVIEKDKILISANEMNNTQENIKYNSHVVLTTFNENYEGLRIFGNAEYFNTGKYYELDKDLFDEEFFKTRGQHIKGAIVVTISKVEEFK